MITVKVKNGFPHIGDRLCSYETAKIRSMIQEFAEVNSEFILPIKYSFVVTELNGFAKIIKTKSKLKKESISDLKSKLKKLQDFKDYVHKRLDEAGVEKEPNGEHSKHGCRIGDRLDIVLSGNFSPPLSPSNNS